MTDQYSHHRSRQVRAIKLQPTFPLNDVEVRRLRRTTIIRSPKLLLMSLFGSWLNKRSFQSHEIQSVFDRAAMLWRDQYEDLTMKAVRHLIEASNTSQDAAIARLVDELDEYGHKEYAITLGKFLILKQTIESEIHMDGIVDRRKEELEVLVDNICQEVCHEIYRASTVAASLAECLTTGDSNDLKIRSERLDEYHQRIRDAYLTLKQTADQVAILLNPGTVICASKDSDYLDQLLKSLQRENTLAKNVDSRLRDELPPFDSQ